MTTAIAKTTPQNDMRTFVMSPEIKKQIMLVLPKHLTPDRFLRVACNMINKTPKLGQCTRESFAQAMLICSQVGLEPDGRNAHLIPYGDQVQVIFDYKGLIALAKRNGVKNIAADIVCENDVFQWERNADGLQFIHRIDYKKKRGDMYAAFCIWKEGDQFDGDVMTKDEIDGIRKRSRAGNAGPWVTDYNEMAKKTVVRRSSKKWTLDPEIADALGKDLDSVVVDAPAATVKPIFGAPEPTGLTLDVPAADDVPMDGPTPLAKTEKAAAPIKKLDAELAEEETAKVFLIRSLDEAGVPFDDLRDYCVSQNISKDSDSWASVDDLPEAVCALLVTPVKLAKIIKTYGAK